VEVLINRNFLNDLVKVPVERRKKIEKFIFKEVKEYNNINNIPNIKKLKGYTNYYRIRFGDYRAGLSFNHNTLVFERLLNRKDIYKFYP